MNRRIKPTPMTLFDLLPILPEKETTSPEERMRSTLRPLLELAIRSKPTKSIKEDPTTCPNCDDSTEDTKSPFCSPHCRETAAFVRQFRASLANDLLETPDRQ